jgi:hypothetical protein
MEASAMFEKEYGKLLEIQQKTMDCIYKKYET